jgi:hypothetical protein
LPIVLSSRDIAAAWGKATHVVAIFSTDAHAFTEGKDDKTSKRSENGKTDKPIAAFLAFVLLIPSSV